jgi:Fic family protein
MDPEQYKHTTAGRVVRSPKGYWAFVPNPLPPDLDWTTSLVSSLSEADRSLTHLANLEFKLSNPHLLVRSFVRREAVLSSRIEGTRATLDDLYLYEAKQLSFLEETSDVREVHNYVRALDYGLERMKSLPVSLRLIREVHARLMEGVRGEKLTPGEFRRSQNWIGPPGSTIESAAFVPPPPEEMLTSLDRLEKFIHAPSGLPPLIRTALIHYQFEAIHPFLDGNGRIGRLLIVLLFSSWGLLSQPAINISAYFESNRQDYYAGLQNVSQSGDWNGWLTFFLNAVSFQSKEAREKIHRLQELREAYLRRLQQDRTLDRLVKVIDLLLGQPIVTIRQVEAYLGVPFPRAQRYVEKLEEHGILQEITGQARNRIYRAGEVLKIIQNPSGN